MKLKDLQQTLHRVDPAAVLVSPQVMNSVIQHIYELPTFLWEVPHRTSYVVDRQVLFRHIEPDDLELNPDHLLPDTVILLLRPSPDDLHGIDREEMLLEYWRRLFHASIHRSLERQIGEGRLTLQEIRRRIEEIGQVSFREAHQVLQEDDYLVPNADEAAVYVELAAVFLELRYFSSNLLPTYFPSLSDYGRVEKILGRGLDVDGLFARTRLANVGDPSPRTDSSFVEANDFYWRMMRHAERAAQVGNMVRAAILRTRAARVAPAELTRSTREQAEGDIKQLTRGLQAALEISDEEREGWTRDLITLLDKADQGSRPVEADLLFDLQNACLDHEREIYALSLFDYVLSAGRRPMKRPLPSRRMVSIINHLRSASQRLTTARLSDSDRQHLGELVEKALGGHETRLRVRFRPVLEAALQDVGLVPENAPERTASHKIIEEILDRIIEHGFLTFADLRDAISRNQLKLPDLNDPKDFARGDPLLRLDRRLATLLDGVYRPSELYMRLLERLTAVNFGTGAGRVVTMFGTIPFGGAVILVEGVQLLLHMVHLPTLSLTTRLTASGLVGLFLLALLHARAFRRRCLKVCKQVGKGAHLLFVELPLRLAQMHWLRRLVNSWPFQLFYWCLLKPTVVTVLLALAFPWMASTVPRAVALFLAVAFVVSSTLGRAAADLLNQTLIRFWELLRGGLLRGLFDFCVYLFKQIVDAIEKVLYTVDEWLRFRRGEGHVSLVVRGLLGVIWFPISYVARFYVVVLIEPGFNPIKAPVSYLAAKFMVPFMKPMTESTAYTLEPVLGSILAWTFAASTIWLLPDAFGFLFWEMKENWSLYRANRSATLKPVRIGPHGETVGSLLLPGFHSGTVPRLYARLRNAERQASRTGNWQKARTYRRSLEAVQKCIALFVQRNLISLLQQSTSWKEVKLRVGEVRLANSQIWIQLLHPDYLDQPMLVEIRQEHGWMMGCVPQSGWLEELPPEQLWPLNSGLATLYKLAGVELLDEQVRAALPATAVTYDVTVERLIAWLDRRHGQALGYWLTDPDSTLLPHRLEDATPLDGPPLDARRLIFDRSPLYWKRLVRCWDGTPGELGHPQLLSGGAESVLPVPMKPLQPSAGQDDLLTRISALAEGLGSHGKTLPAEVSEPQA